MSEMTALASILREEMPPVNTEHPDEPETSHGEEKPTLGATVASWIASHKARKARLKAELEEKYGALVADEEVFTVWSADQDWQICRQCRGVPCLKGEHEERYVLSKVQVVNGQVQARKGKCPQWGAYVNEQCDRAGVPPVYIGKTFSDYKRTADNAEAIEIARWYVEKYPRRGLYFYGGVGTGKTLLASIVIRGLIEKGKRVIFGDVPTLLKRIKERFEVANRLEADDNITSAMVLEKYISAPVLVLDDLGAGYVTAWTVGVLYEIINERYSAGLRTIVTSNYDLEQLARRLSVKGAEFEGERIASRLTEGSEEGFFGGNDWRRRKA